MQQCRRFYISGRVQGVFFRDSARRRALDLGLSGWAHNLPDGRVEVLACGAPAALAEMEAWLWQGPPSAEVMDIESHTFEGQAPRGFTIA
ncbi:MAG: acylphosphatase [Gammaproteobacteria bacterium]